MFEIWFYDHTVNIGMYIIISPTGQQVLWSWLDFVGT